MLKQTDILKAVEHKIKQFDKNAKVYSGEVIEGYTRPCFFIDAIPITRRQEMANRYEVTMLVVISYFSDTLKKNVNYDFLDELLISFKGVLPIKDKVLTINEFNLDEIGKSEFNLSLSLKYKDTIDIGTESNKEIAREVYTRLE